MPVPFLLVLVGALGAPAAATQGPSLQGFTSEPLVLWKAGTRVRQWLSAGPAQAFATSPKVPQLTNQRTGVTCSMRILEVKPVPDGEMVAPAAGPHPDPIVRNSHSPCVE